MHPFHTPPPTQTVIATNPRTACYWPINYKQRYEKEPWTLSAPFRVVVSSIPDSGINNEVRRRGVRDGRLFGEGWEKRTEFSLSFPVNLTTLESQQFVVHSEVVFIHEARSQTSSHPHTHFGAGSSTPQTFLPARTSAPLGTEPTSSH